MKPIKFIALSLLFASATFAVAQNPSNYRPAVYPQQQESVGNATLEETTNGSAIEYLFKNDVLDAKFVKEGTTLKFGGSIAMDLVAGTEIFTVKLGDGSKVVKASEMQLVSVTHSDLTANTKAIKGAEHFGGKQLKATFTYEVEAGKTLTVVWTAELRDGSHYVKTDVNLSANADIKMFAVIPMQYNVNVKTSGKEAPAPVGDARLRGRVVSNGKIFALLDTPTALNTAGTGGTAAAEGELLKTWADTWEASSWQVVGQGQVPHRITELALDYPKVSYKDYPITFDQTGALNVAFHYAKVGNHRLNMCGVELIKDGQVVNGKYHIGYTGNQESNNIYSLDVTQTGDYTLRMYVDNTETIDSKGNIDIQLVKPAEEAAAEGDIVPIQGLWSRNVNLAAGKSWNVGSVVGLMANGEDRRSVLAYLERERAVPWRPYPIYNSWYELNINRTNKKPYDYDNLKVEQTVDVMKQWKEHMFDTQGVSIQAFVWDDGWDKYGTWDFNAGFPNGFKEPDVIARQMCSGQGAWLGPCGGYDTAGAQRQKYWTDQGMQCNLHNPTYYNVFYNACKRLCDDYEFRYFKFDGISTLSPAYGPANGTNGEEDAEGIINVEREIRKFKPEIFFNTTVGTWASTAWLNISDAVWRHHGDHGYAGTNPNKREQWITYRDQYIYQHYVKENRLMTINSMMSHGFMLSNYGGPNDMPKDYASVLRELRCAFACGSSQVELYSDYALMNQIEGGKLWKDMADLIKWQRKNADVLPDTHWVGGDPAKEEVYGWAAWNGNKAVLSLRNGKDASQTFTINLRRDLNIPQGVNTQIRLTKSFDDQAALQGLTEGQLLDIDTDYTVTLPPSTVFMFDGLDRDAKLVPVSAINFDVESVEIPAGRAVAPAYTIEPLAASDKTLTWTTDNPDVATVSDGAITGKKVGTAHITATATNGVTKTVTVTVLENLQNDLETLIEKAQADYDAHDVDVYSAGIITEPTQFYSEYTETKANQGDILHLLDGDGTTFWHSKWDGVSNLQPHVHYLQVNLPEAISGTIQMDMMRRINNGKLCDNDNPVLMSVEVSADGTNWTPLSGQMELPLGSVAEPHVYGTFEVTEPTKYFRFFSDQNNGTTQRGYWHCGDFQLRKFEQEAPNKLHATEAQTLLDAITAARNVETVTAETIDTLQQAYDAYLAAVGQSVPTVPTATITAVFPDGSKHIVYSDGTKLTAGATAPAGSISTFTVARRDAEAGTIVLKAGDKYLHITCGEDKSDKDKMSDWDGLSDEENEWTTLTLEVPPTSGIITNKRQGNQTVVGQWDAPAANYRMIKGKTSNNNNYYLTLRSSDDKWIASNPQDKYFDSNWDGVGCRTSFFEVTITEPVAPNTALKEAKDAYDQLVAAATAFYEEYGENEELYDVVAQLMDAIYPSEDFFLKQEAGELTAEDYIEATKLLQQALDAAQEALEALNPTDLTLEEAKAQFDEVKASAYDLVEEYKYNEVEGVQDMLLEFISKVIGLNMELSKKPEEEMTAADYVKGTNSVQDLLDEAVAALQALNFGRTLPIPAGIYEIQNAESRDNRGYLVDYKGWGNGPALAECKLNGHVDKHPTDRNEEGVTSSYWYVYPKTVGETVQYYIFNLGSLQEDGLPRFLKPGAARSARTTYTYAPEALVIKEHTTTYTVGDNTYKHMLISDAATPNIVMSAACGKTSDSGDAVGADENVNDGGAVWQFNNTWMRLTDTQKETLDRAIQYINGEATISGAVLVIEKAKAGKAQKNDIDRLSDIILQK